MSRASPKASVHSRARQRLIERMDELSAAGIKCLPGLRDLGKELGVSFMTVNKVVKRLAMEGRIQIVPCKGNYIAEAVTRFNVGIVMGNVADVTFLHQPSVMKGMLEVFEKSCCHLRVLQFSQPERAKSFVSDYKLDALIWYLPESSLFPKITAVMKVVRVPMVSVVQNPVGAKGVELPPCHVASDFRAIGHARAEYLLKRGHRRIARFNVPSFSKGYEGEEYEGFAASLSREGGICEPAWRVRSEDTFKRIPALLDEGAVTAAVVNGGEQAMRNVFQALDDHERGAGIELLVDYIGGSLPDLIADFPRLNVVAVNHHPDNELGVAAGRAILNCLRDGTPVVSTRIGPQMRLPDGTPGNGTSNPKSESRNPK